MTPHDAIRAKFSIHQRDCIPYTARKVANDGSRNQLGSLFAELGYTKGAEIGVKKGQFSAVLMTPNPKLTLWCVDPWAAYWEINSANRMEGYYKLAVANLARFPGAVIKRGYSVDVAKEVEDRSFDFVYIDGAHDFDNVIQDLIAWGRKVRSGGIIAGHDYVHSDRCQVIYAVDAYRLSRGVHQWYLTCDWPQSFFWVQS